MFCKLEKYIKITYPYNKDYYKYEYNIKKMKQEKSILRLNILLGNSEPCRCKECNPDTKNN